MSTPIRVIAGRASGNSISLVPGDAETHCGIDHADHAVGLRKITPQFARARVDMLREQTVAVAAGEYAFEQYAGLVLPSQRRQRVDIPEGANRKSVLRNAEVVRNAVAEEELAAPQLLLDRLDRRGEARVVGAQEIELVKEEQARVQVLAAESGGEGPALLVPGPLADRRMHRVGARAPRARAVREPDARGDLREAVAPRPAHDAREGMHALRPEQLPQAGVGLVEERGGALAELLELAEERLVAAQREPRVEEHVRRGEDRRSEDVVLDLRIRLIADPHRTHAAVAGQRSDLALLDARLAADRVDRLQIAAVGARGDIDDVVEVAFHRPRRVHPVQGVHHEVRVAQPAVPVISVPAARA